MWRDSLTSTGLERLWTCMPLQNDSHHDRFQPPDIPGAADLAAFFGYWPTFHDAEVLTIALDRYSGCRVVIHAFRMTSGVDSAGYYVLDKHAIVTFIIEGFPADSSGIVNTGIEGFNYQNVLATALASAD